VSRSLGEDLLQLSAKPKMAAEGEGKVLPQHRGWEGAGSGDAGPWDEAPAAAQLRARTRRTPHVGGNPWKLPPPGNTAPAVFVHELLQQPSFQGPGSIPSLLEVKAEPEAVLHPSGSCSLQSCFSPSFSPPPATGEAGAEAALPQSQPGALEKHWDQRSLFGSCHP